MSVPLETYDTCVALFGLNDQNMQLIEDAFQVRIQLQNNALHVAGEEQKTELAERVIEEMMQLLGAGEMLTTSRIRSLIALAQDDKLVKEETKKRTGAVAYTHAGRKIVCKTAGQQRYVDAVREHGLTIAIGPAGTGKTYLAMALAAVALRNKEVERIILTRPAVEAGEKLGFLPGDMAQKVDPYLRPLYDALFEIMGLEAYQRLMDRGAIEVAPLAFMRGRTLNDAFIILDEAQNATPEQMKMFLTRMGKNSRAIVTGDPSQIDLPYARQSGLMVALKVLSGVEGISIIRLAKEDVVRNDLVQRIVEAYEAFDQKGMTDA